MKSQTVGRATAAGLKIEQLDVYL